MNKSNESNQLKKEISLLQATLLVVGIVIGSGVFFKPASVFKNAGAPGMGIIVWIVGAILTICGALSISEIGAAIPKTGGLFTYLRELYGKQIAFLLGWVQVLVYYPGLCAALAVIVATQSTTFVPLNNYQQKILAVALLLFITAIDVVSTKFATKFSSLCTIAKLIPIFVIVIAGFAMGTVHDFTPMVTEKSTSAGFGAALMGVLFAFEGWVAVSNLSGEMKNPIKDFPKAIILGLGIVTIAYLGVNLAILNTMPIDSISASQKAASDASAILFGKSGEILVAVGILISIIGCLSALLITAGRVPYAMAADKLFIFEGFFGKVSDKFGTPANATLFEGVLACIYALSGSFNTLTDLAIFVIWMFFILGIAGVFVLRTKRKDLIKPDTYKVPLYPIIPIIGIVGAVYVVINTLITNPTNALFGIGVTIIGIPVYFYIRKTNAKDDQIIST